LVQQHYDTFRERMNPFPINIDMLSRFRTKQEQKKVIDDLEEGKVDIIIGTHRLIQNDIRFKDLGLLIVDEEQRFGVLHKERIKKLKENIFKIKNWFSVICFLFLDKENQFTVSGF
ncbi:unnamed protein product, partial [marine sediment metagenome]